MPKENHMGMLQYCPKQATFQPICSFNSWAEPKCYLGIISPNRGLSSHKDGLLDEVSLSSKIAWECWAWWISMEVDIHWICGFPNLNTVGFLSDISAYIVIPCQNYRYL